MPGQKRLYRLKPIVRNCSWGGKELAARLNVDTNVIRAGEIVAAGGFGDRDSEVVGLDMRLSQLYTEQPGLFGTKSALFPLTINLIDAESPLSVQVHPDEEYAMRNEGRSGLSEAWVVLDCENDGWIIAGHTAETNEEFTKLSESGGWNELLRVTRVKKWDFIFLPPGTVHSIGAGTKVYEVTDASDIVYRLYDYNREDEKRPLDRQKALDVIYSPQRVDIRPPEKTERFPNIVSTVYMDNPGAFTIKRLEVLGASSWKQEGFAVLTVLEGSGTVNEEELKTGHTVLIPRGYGEILFTGAFTAMLSSYMG